MAQVMESAVSSADCNRNPLKPFPNSRSAQVPPHFIREYKVKGIAPCIAAFTLPFGLLFPHAQQCIKYRIHSGKRPFLFVLQICKYVLSVCTSSTRLAELPIYANFLPVKIDTVPCQTDQLTFTQACNFRYYGVNVPEGVAMEVSRESGFTSGLIDFRALCIADGKPIVPGAFVKLEVTAA